MIINGTTYKPASLSANETMTEIQANVPFLSTALFSVSFSSSYLFSTEIESRGQRILVSSLLALLLQDRRVVSNLPLAWRRHFMFAGRVSGNGRFRHFPEQHLLVGRTGCPVCRSDPGRLILNLRVCHSPTRAVARYASSREFCHWAEQKRKSPGARVEIDVGGRSRRPVRCKWGGGLGDDTLKEVSSSRHENPTPSTCSNILN